METHFRMKPLPLIASLALTGCFAHVQQTAPTASTAEVGASIVKASGGVTKAKASAGKAQTSVEAARSIADRMDANEKTVWEYLQQTKP